MEGNPRNDRRTGDKLLIRRNYPATMKSKNIFTAFRRVAFAEGISFLILLLIAMPLKYFVGIPMAVTIIGGLHGVLFVGFIILAFLARAEYGKNLKWLAKAFIASLLPFGTIVMDKEWKLEQAAIV